MQEATPWNPMRSTWNHPVQRAVILGLFVVSIVSAVVLLLGLLSEDAAFTFSSWIYVIVPLGAGAVLIDAAMTLTGKNRVAWLLIGVGVLSWAFGEVIWAVYEWFLAVEVPYPGWADVFYVAGYPLVLVGILVLPHVKSRGLERVRLFLDATAGTIAVAAIMWVAYLNELIYLDSEISLLEQYINIMYAVGDLFLLIAVMILAVRRSSFRFDPRLVAIALGLLIDAATDIIYVPMEEAGTYVSGGWLDGVWLLAYAAYIAAAWYLLEPEVNTEQVQRTSRLWQLGAPYGAIALLFGLTLLETGGDASTLQIASGIVGMLVIGRQGVAIRENRQFVEKQRTELIASISHELRTPLTGVIGFTALLDNEWENLDDGERAEMISIVNDQAQHISRIVTDLVGLARNTLETTHLELGDHNVDLLVRDGVAMVPRLVDGTVTLETDIQPGLTVYGDRGRLIQVLVNFLTNAIRYGDGAIQLDARAERGQIVIDVHDNGPGVQKRYEEAIWDRFERGAHRYDAAIPGSGIGLPIARMLVEAHGGSASYHRSAKLGGSRFTMSIPTQATASETALSATGASA
jgi:signal transduction histidine kinase